MGRVIAGWWRGLFDRLFSPHDVTNSVHNGPARAHEAEEIFQAVNISKGSVVASRIRWAGDSASRRRGLLDRHRIEADEGIYIVPTQWIHMFGMRFPIDVAFLASDGRVLFTHHGIKPNRLSRLVWRAEGALELASGTLRATETIPGDIIELRAR
jgi:uncharacterized membrane protein (UPF0127 family)